MVTSKGNFIWLVFSTSPNIATLLSASRTREFRIVKYLRRGSGFRDWSLQAVRARARSSNRQQQTARNGPTPPQCDHNGPLLASTPTPALTMTTDGLPAGFVVIVRAGAGLGWSGDPCGCPGVGLGRSIPFSVRKLM